MKQSGQISRGGFTLIELLTVIAIIGILAALTAAVLPRALERAKVVNIESTMNQVKIVLVDYFADHGSYPAAYGYVNDGGRGLPAAELLDAIHRVYRPYMYTAGEFNDFDLYDNFGKDGGDTNRDGNIGFLEFSPVGTRSGASAYTFVPEIYNGSNLPTEVSAQLRAHRPLIYIPVNRRQVKQAES